MLLLGLRFARTNRYCTILDISYHISIELVTLLRDQLVKRFVKWYGTFFDNHCTNFIVMVLIILKYMLHIQ